MHDIDPDLHRAVERDQPYDITTKHDRYWTINGRSFPDTIAADGGGVPAEPAVRGARAGAARDRGARCRHSSAWRTPGMSNHPFHPHGNHVRVIAQDGRLLGAGTEPVVRAVHADGRVGADLRPALQVDERRELVADPPAPGHAAAASQPRLQGQRDLVQRQPLPREEGGAAGRRRSRTTAAASTTTRGTATRSTSSRTSTRASAGWRPCFASTRPSARGPHRHVPARDPSTSGKELTGHARTIQEGDPAGLVLLAVARCRARPASSAPVRSSWSRAQAARLFPASPTRRRSTSAPTKGRSTCPAWRTASRSGASRSTPVRGLRAGRPCPARCSSVDVGDDVTVNLQNNLAEPVSIVFPGQDIDPERRVVAPAGGSGSYDVHRERARDVHLRSRHEHVRPGRDGPLRRPDRAPLTTGQAYGAGDGVRRRGGPRPQRDRPEPEQQPRPERLRLRRRSRRLHGRLPPDVLPDQRRGLPRHRRHRGDGRRPRPAPLRERRALASHDDPARRAPAGHREGRLSRPAQRVRRGRGDDPGRVDPRHHRHARQRRSRGPVSRSTAASST